MPITVICPGCEAKLNAPDTAAGKKVKCPRAGCGTIVAVPAPSVPLFEEIENDPPPRPAKKKAAPAAVEDDLPPKKKRRDQEDEDDDRPRSKRRLADDDEDERPASKRRRGDDDDDDDEDQPRKKKTQKGGRLPPAAIAGIVLGGLLLLGAVGYGIYALAFQKSETASSGGGGGGGGGGSGSSLDGTYLIVAVESRGEKIPAEMLAMAPESERTIRIVGNKFIANKGKKEDSIDVKLDSSKTPAQITMTEPDGKKSKTTYGIYKLEGDTLTICTVESDKEADRPREFKTSKETKAELITLKKSGGGVTGGTVATTGTGATTETAQTGGSGPDGIYLVIGMEAQGLNMTDVVVKMPEAMRTIKIAGNKLTSTMGKKEQTIDVKFDPSKTPAQVTTTEAKGKKTETAYGIYKIEGDVLTMCMVTSDKEGDRPKEFKVGKDSKATLMTLKKK